MQSLRFTLVSLILPLAMCVAKDIEPTVEGDTLSFALPDLNGKIVKHTDERFVGKVVLVDIWGTWCPPCREAIPKLSEMQEEFGDDLVVVGVAFEEFEDTQSRRKWIRKRAPKLEINYLILDGGTTADVGKAFPTLKGFQGFPTMIVIGTDGVVTHANTVYIPREEPTIQKEVEKALGVAD